MKSQKRTLTLVVSALLTTSFMMAQTQKADTTAVKKSSKEESNRNVMLNASDDTGPRQISIGLPQACSAATSSTMAGKLF